jgi:hypothetical protein
MAKLDDRNFILDKLYTDEIIKKGETLNQVYTGYETDDTRYRIVFKSYLIDYYCAVLTDQERVKELEVPAVFDAATLGNIQAAIKESSINKEMLQSYLEKKRLSCERARALGFSVDVCSNYIKGLETFLEYVPKTKPSVDVSFVVVKKFDRENYDKNALRIEGKPTSFRFFLETDLPKHGVNSSFTLQEEEQPKLLEEHQSKIDELKNDGGFAISFGNGLDGYNTTIKLFNQFIAEGWIITHVEILYPGDIEFTTITKAPQHILGISSAAILQFTDVDLTRVLEDKSFFLKDKKYYFNGTMLISMMRDTKKLTILTLASRDDFHDIAIAPLISQTIGKTTEVKSLVPITNKQKPSALYPTGNPDELMTKDKMTSQQNTKDKTISQQNTLEVLQLMRKSIYTTDLYHVLRYAIKNDDAKLEFFTLTGKLFLYPAKVTSFTSDADIEAKAKDDTSPAILLSRFRTVLKTSGASKLHVFATLKTDDPEDDRMTIANMKTIAYANRLRSTADKPPKTKIPKP